MSQHFRPAVGSQPAMAGRMMSPNCPTSHLPGIMPVVPSPYGLVTAHPQYISHPPYTHNIQNVQANQMPMLTAVRGPLPGMYVPVAPLNAGISPMNVDPTKLLEEQRKLEKERNFQLQQQRLKQFTVAGKKGSLNAENLIDSMFGKVPPKQSIAPSSSFGEFLDSESSESVTPKSTFESAQSHLLHAAAVDQEVHKIVPQKPVKKDKKELDAMMQECSNLKSGPQKAHTFTKPAVRELAPATQQRSTFTASNKARDWKNLQGFEEVFVANKPRMSGFPEWCKKESIPELYRQIEAFVTSNGTNPPDTKLLFPILISSGLSHQTLGQIWELVNQSAPGCLTAEEMYAALALIAVTQAGHPVKTVDILHQLPACPIPQLQCFAPQSTTNDQPTNALQQTAINETMQVEAPHKEARTHQVLRPSAISLKPNTSVAGGNASTNVNASGSGFISSPDDDFDDFKSATPTAVNFSMNTPSSVWTQNNDDFDDFQQAPPSFSTANQHIETVASNKHITSNLTGNRPILSENKVPGPPLSDPKIPVPPLSENKAPEPSLSESKFPSLVMTGKKGSVPVLSGNKCTVPTGQLSAPIPPVSQDLMSPDEDKYSVFRSLQQTEELDEWGDFSAAATGHMGSLKQTDLDESSQSNTPTFPSEFLSNPSTIPHVQSDGTDFFRHTSGSDPVRNNLFCGDQSYIAKENDDFGDFLHAEAAPISAGSVTRQLEQLSTNFADFANFKEQVVPSAFPTQVDDEFGEFASSMPGKSELGHEFAFQHVKDNISLAESQSVSSLELGTFDGGGHSGESKSSLSRQGSIPSLELKNGGVELADSEEFGEFQSPAFVRASKTPSPSKDLRMNSSINTSGNSLSLSFQNSRNAPLIDKYSVIRSEEKKDEDQHISCWIRCLQSSVNILQNTKKIFNQMSCSSVCNEVLKSEEGENYIRDVIEVYKVITRISVASKAAGKQTIPMLDLLNEAKQAWNTISGFIAGSTLMPEDSSLEFSNAVLSSNSEDNTQACGLCLLNIDIKSKTKNKEESLKLSYGGRNYHSTCANLWVNCVDRLLPALPLPQLL